MTRVKFIQEGRPDSAGPRAGAIDSGGGVNLSATRATHRTMLHQERRYTWLDTLSRVARVA